MCNGIHIRCLTVGDVARVECPVSGHAAPLQMLYNYALLLISTHTH